MSRFLGGSDVGFEIPGLGVFVGPNITPDKETGIGSWTAEEIVSAIQTGVRPDGRILAPIMPWHAFAHLTENVKGYGCRPATCWPDAEAGVRKPPGKNPRDGERGFKVYGDLTFSLGLLRPS